MRDQAKSGAAQHMNRALLWETRVTPGFCLPLESPMENKALLTAGLLIVAGLLLAPVLPFIGLPFLLLGILLLAVSW
jgi:hypothetical protein